MAVQGDTGTKDEIKKQFTTIEGVYRLLPLSEYSRPSRVAYNNSAGNATSPPVKVSFVWIPEPSGSSSTNSNNSNGDRTKICFNYGRELFVYTYRGVKKAVFQAADLTKHIDKRAYNKEEVPTCHDFNQSTASPEGVSLLVGLLGGQVQLIDPITKDLNKAYNAGERLIDKTKVTCIRWLPGSPNQFLVSHSSGQMYVYNEELLCVLDRPHYQLFKQGEGYAVYTCKTKSTRNPLYRWVVGEGSINQFAFSPCSKYLAVVAQDGYLRVFNFDTMDLVGCARSYYGGLLCVCWSPDGRYVVTGGEDDLITIWSFHEKRVVARGQGHKSWVTVVAFDPYTTLYSSDVDTYDLCNEDTTKHNSYVNDYRKGNSTPNSRSNSNRNSVASDKLNLSVLSYRLGSVGQDTLFCLWDLKDDLLRQPYRRPRSSTVVSSSGGVGGQQAGQQPTTAKCNSVKESTALSDSSHHSHSSNSLTAKLANLNFGEKRDKEKGEKDHKRNLSLACKNSTSNCNKSSTQKNQTSSGDTDSFKRIGSCVCPRLDECPVLEPLVCKKIGHERLSGLVFREDCIVTSCQDGCVLTWGRPGRQPPSNQHSSPSPTSARAMGGGGPMASGGTVV
ncbi:WD repeat-containing protein 20 isoform X2 [Oratosquilla oratoria]|uniref:WD repeat-containing protein 20 isoform X2 n=1 Tax=Oratosquilla oratoria TaxID=337810 RepID=UPI003F7668C4